MYYRKMDATQLFNSLASEFITLFIVIDPIGVLPLFVGLTKRMPTPQARKVAIKSIFIAGIVLLGFAFLGQILLEALSVRITSFRIAGGIILFLFGVKMIFGAEFEEKSAQSAETGHDIAVFPLAIPSIAGPGAMLAVVVQIAYGAQTTIELFSKIFVLLAVLSTTLVLFIFAKPVTKIIGVTGGSVIVRVMGILLSAIAVESVTLALRELHAFAP